MAETEGGFSVSGQIVSVQVVMFKCGQKAPCHGYSLDVKLTSDDMDLNYFKRRILQREGVESVRRDIGLLRYKCHVGYSRKEPNLEKYTCFKESFNNDQWNIALNKIIASKNPVYMPTGKSSILLE